MQTGGKIFTNVFNGLREKFGARGCGKTEGRGQGTGGLRAAGSLSGPIVLGRGLLPAG